MARQLLKQIEPGFEPVKGTMKYKDPTGNCTIKVKINDPTKKGLFQRIKHLVKKQKPSPAGPYERRQHDSSNCGYELPGYPDIYQEWNDDPCYMDTPREQDTSNSPAVPPRRRTSKTIDRQRDNDLYYNTTWQPVAPKIHESPESVAQLHLSPEPEQGVSDYQNRGGENFSFDDYNHVEEDPTSLNNSLQSNDSCNSSTDKFGAEMQAIYGQMQRRWSHKSGKDDKQEQEQEDSEYASIIPRTSTMLCTTLERNEDRTT